MRSGRLSDVFGPVMVCVAMAGTPAKFGVFAKNSTAYCGRGFCEGGTCGGFVQTSAKLTVPSSSLWVAIPVTYPEFRFDVTGWPRFPGACGNLSICCTNVPAVPCSPSSSESGFLDEIAMHNGTA